MKEETLLEQMTKVRPEVLNENALKLFNEIMKVIDERDKLLEDYYKLEDKYIHNVPCCNEEDCSFFKEYQQLQEKLNER